MDTTKLWVVYIKNSISLLGKTGLLSVSNISFPEVSFNSLVTKMRTGFSLRELQERVQQ